MSEILEGDYQGNAMLIIRNTAQDKFPFQFGLKKAKIDLGALGRHQEVRRKPSQLKQRRGTREKGRERKKATNELFARPLPRP